MRVRPAGADGSRALPPQRHLPDTRWCHCTFPPKPPRAAAPRHRRAGRAQPPVLTSRSALPPFRPQNIGGFLLLNAVLSTTTLPFAPLFRDPPDRQLATSGGEKDPKEKPPLDSGRINTILWLTDWRVALLLIGSTYILGLGLTFLVS